MKFNFKLTLNGVNPEKLYRAQQLVDSEIIRRSSDYVPHDTGWLKKSVTFGTKIGTGIIKYNASYAKKQYFKGKSSGQRGRLWVRRMWASQGKDIVRNAKKILNGK